MSRGFLAAKRLTPGWLAIALACAACQGEPPRELRLELPELITSKDPVLLHVRGVQQDGTTRDIADLPVLVLLDLKLPRIDGLEVLRRVRSDPRTRRVPVVILTSSREEQDVATGYDLGVNSYIRKPVDFNQFAEVIKQLGLYWLVINEAPSGE